jgi:hypothetical protein
MSTLSRWTFASVGLLALAATEAWENNEFAHAMEKHRKLQANPDAYCLEAIGGLAQCYVDKCLTEFCDIEPGGKWISETEPSRKYPQPYLIYLNVCFLVIPDPPEDAATSGCDMLTQAFCVNFEDQCCPDCEAATQAYIDCIIGSSFLNELCPDASCSSSNGNTTTPDGNMTIPESNMTMPDLTDVMGETGTEIPDTGMQGFSFCVQEITEVFGCYLSQCAERECDAELGTINPDAGTDDMITNCEEFTGAFCNAFFAANACCPECAEATTAYSTCALSEWVSPHCPNATCEGGLIIETSKGGPVVRTVNDGEAPGAESGSSSKPSTTLTHYGTESGSVRQAASSALAVMGIAYLLI